MADPWSHASTSSDPQSLSSPASDFEPDAIGHNWAVYLRKVKCRVCKRNAGKFSFNPTKQVSKRFQVLVVYSHLNVDDEVVWNCRSVVFWDEWQDEIIEEMKKSKQTVLMREKVPANTGTNDMKFRKTTTI